MTECAWVKAIAKNKEEAERIRIAMEEAVAKNKEEAVAKNNSELSDSNVEEM